MKCYYCDKEILVEYEQKLADQYLTFLKDHNIFVESLSVVENDKKRIAKELYFNIQNDMNFINEYSEFSHSLYNDQLKCPECNSSVYLNVANHIEYSIYNDLCEIELEQLNAYFKKKLNKDVSALFSLSINYCGPVYYYLEILKQFFPDDYEYFHNIHVFLDRFNPSGGRGGDGEYQVFSIIYNFITDEFVRSAVCDLLKYSGIFVFTKIVSYFRKQKIIVKANRKAVEIIDESENKEYYYEGLIFKYMSKKDKKKMVKKVTKKMSKEIKQKIKKALL